METRSSRGVPEFGLEEFVQSLREDHPARRELRSLRTLQEVVLRESSGETRELALECRRLREENRKEYLAWLE